MLIDSEIYFSSPKEFNDPYDCKSITIYKGSFDDWKDFFIRNGLSDAESTNLANNMKGKVLTDDDLNSHHLDHDLNRICCFSETNESILMWSHYADKHTGICIEYTTIDEGIFSAIPLDDSLQQINDPVLNKYFTLSRVDYQVKMPNAYNRLQDDNKYFIQFLKTKHTDWSYEREIRIIAVNSLLKNNPVKISRSCITGIIFGLNIDNTIRQKYIDIAQKYFVSQGYPINLYQCKEIIGYYAVEVKDYII